MAVRALRRLSQNFLVDRQQCDKIVRVSELEGKVLEVGPGTGMLTRALLERHAVVAVEKDSRCLQHLEALSSPSLRVIHGDILNLDYDELVEPGVTWSVMGNLPFNIASPLLDRWFKDIAHGQGLFRGRVARVSVMVQKEVGERLAALPRTSARSRLSVMAQAACDSVKLVYKVPARAFVPRPKVDAVVVQMTPRAFDPQQAEVYDQLALLTRHFFSQRRKTIHHILK